MKAYVRTKTSMQIFIVSLLITVKNWKQPKCLSIDEWIKILHSVYKMELYSAFKGINTYIQ